jgi:hypothetical protein
MNKLFTDLLNPVWVLATDRQTVHSSAQQLKQLQEAVQPFELGSAVLEPELDVFVL